MIRLRFFFLNSERNRVSIIKEGSAQPQKIATVRTGIRRKVGDFRRDPQPTSMQHPRAKMTTWRSCSIRAIMLRHSAEGSRTELNMKSEAGGGAAQFVRLLRPGRAATAAVCQHGLGPGPSLSSGTA